MMIDSGCDELDRDLVNIICSDGNQVYLHDAIFNAYFSQRQIPYTISMTRPSALLLMDLLNGDLFDQSYVSWIDNKIKTRYNKDAMTFNDAVQGIKKWMEVKAVAVDLIDQEALGFIE